MRSEVCQPILPWLLFLILPFIAIATKKHYAVDYGDGLGDANIELDEDTHIAYIIPPHATSPTTLINLRKGLVVYVSPKECMVANLKAGEHKYKQHVAHAVNHTRKQPTFYVVGSIPPRKVRKFVGKEIFAWCKQKPTLRLSKQRPKLPSNKFSLKTDVPTTDEATNQLYKETDEVMDGTDHQRYKRKAKKGKRSKGKKGKSRGNRGRGKKSKNKKKKTPKTKSLKSKSQKLNVTAPQIEFPLVHITQTLTDNSTNTQNPKDHVVLQEEPYLSPSFIRSGEDGQRFRHYRDFYQESNANDNDTHVPDQINRIISPDTRSGAERHSRISIPETIVKDGQIFYRYDAAENTARSEKGQSKRSHTRDQDFMDDDAELGRGFDYYSDSNSSLDEFSLPTDQVKHNSLEDSDRSHASNNFNFQHGVSHVQTQAQMGDGKLGASAGTISSTGPATHVQGSSDSDGFFIAQAHSTDHQGGTSLTHVFGNKHGVQGSAMTRGHGHQSNVQVEMGAHPSSTAHVLSHGGSNLLSSSVQATQLGGSAGAQAYGNGASASHAQMEFNPTHPYHGGRDGLRGQGSASATVTNGGSALLTSLAGEVSGGSYLGTAHSRIGTDTEISSGDENNTYSAHEDFSQSDGLTYEFGETDQNLDSLTLNSQFNEDLTHERQAYEEAHHSEEPFREGSTGLGQEGASHADHITDPSSSGHSSGKHMIGNIMETVHQPDMQPEIIAYPASEFNIIDDGGLTVGAGTPPRESEIEQAPISDFGEIQEGVSRSPGASKAGLVGLATYSHGRLGAPPGPGELLNTPHQQGSSQYDYRYYDDGYSSEYYEDEYSNLGPQDPNNLPFFDLGPEIVGGFKPLESNYENFQPMLVPGQQANEPSINHLDHLVTALPNLHRYDELDSQEITPDPPIIVHQVQAPTLLPDDTSSGEMLTSHSQPQYPSRSYISPSNETFPDYYSFTPSSQPVTETPQTSHAPTAEPTERTSRYHSPADTHMPPLLTAVSPDRRMSFDPPRVHTEAHSPAARQESFDSWPDLQSRTQQFSQPQNQESLDSRPNLQPRTQLFSQPQDQESLDSRPDLQPRTQLFSQPQDQEPIESRPDLQPRTQLFSQPQDQEPLESRPDLQPRTQLFSQPQDQESLDSWPDLQPRTQQFSQPQDPIAENVTSEVITEMTMETVPLYPGVPGSRHTLPGNQGWPNVNVMTLSASEAKADRSLLYQRPGTPIQPGEKIPGAPGYRVPSGFRGHVILGHDLPVSADSRKVVQGFNTHVQLSPQNPPSDRAVYASVSGPGASQQLASRENPAGVHITLSGDGGYSQTSHSSVTMTDSHSSSAGDLNRGSMVSSQQRDFTHSAMHSQPHSTSSGKSWGTRGHATPRKSWDGRQHSMGNSQNSQNSWSSESWSAAGAMQPQDNGDSCGYYSMNCEVVYGPYDRSQICKPILITIDCCC